jgi:hypothetical protein
VQSEQIIDPSDGKNPANSTGLEPSPAPSAAQRYGNDETGLAEEMTGPTLPTELFS